MHQLKYSKRAIEDLKKIDNLLRIRIIKKLMFFSEQRDISLFCKKLLIPGRDYYRFRIGTYRAMFSINKDGNINILYILNIKHRKDIYRV